MIVRRYEATTEEEALRKVDADLGPRAVILLTKQEPGENCEVVAAINPMDIAPEGSDPRRPPWRVCGRRNPTRLRSGSRWEARTSALLGAGLGQEPRPWTTRRG